MKYQLTTKAATLFFLLLLMGVQPIIISAKEALNPIPDKHNISVSKADSLIRVAEKQQVVLSLESKNNALQALNILKNSKHNDTLLVKAYFQTAFAYFMLGSLDSSSYYFNELLKMPEIEAAMKGKAYIYLCIDSRRLAKYNEALDYANKAILAYNSINDTSGLMRGIITSAKVYHEIGDNETAANMYFRALKLAKQVNNKFEEGLLYSLLGDVYMDIDQNDKGKRYYKKAIDTFKKDFDTTYMFADIINNYGIVFYEEGSYDSALFYYNKAFDIYQRNNQKDAIAVSYQNIGLTYVFLHQQKIGFDYLHRSYKMFKELNLKRDQVSVLIDLGTAFNRIETFDSAGFYLNKALQIATSINNTYYIKQSLQSLYELNKKMKSYDKALLYYHKYVAFKDSVDNIKMQRNLQELEVKYQSAQREKEISELRNKELIAKSRNRLLISIVVAIGVVLLLLIFGFWLKRKKDIQIHKQKLLVYEKEKMANKSKMAEEKALKKQMESEIEFKTKQLASHALNMMQKNILLQEITEAIENRMKKTDDEGKQVLKEILHQLRLSLNVDKDWNLFKLYFDQINESFFENLKKRNPKLTGNDFKLCALIKLNMSIKEIASVLNNTPESIKNARYRLKKKLNIKNDENLNEVIMNM